MFCFAENNLGVSAAYHICLKSAGKTVVKVGMIFFKI